MTVLSSAQIRAFAQGAGFSGDVLDTMVAIAFAESGGNPDSHNSTPPDDSYGLWQINMNGNLGPSRRIIFGISSNDQLFDPKTNAHAAHVIYKGSGLHAWTTYTSGKYKQFLTGAKPDTTGVTSDSNGGLLSGITSSINAVGTNLFNGIANIAGILVAIVLVAIGIILLASQSKAGKDAVSKAVSVTPLGNLGKVASAASKKAAPAAKETAKKAVKKVADTAKEVNQ